MSDRGAGDRHESVKDYRDHQPEDPVAFEKVTLFRGEHLFLGLNRLEPGAEQAVHTHARQDKFYHVVEGRGLFTVGEVTREAAPGTSVWAAAGVPHGVRNDGDGVLVLLVGIAPPP
jgi:quercetin dioxygenase-like cupin family protein